MAGVGRRPPLRRNVQNAQVRGMGVLEGDNQGFGDPPPTSLLYTPQLHRRAPVGAVRVCMLVGARHHKREHHEGLRRRLRHHTDPVLLMGHICCLWNVHALPHLLCQEAMKAMVGISFWEEFEVDVGDDVLDGIEDGPQLVYLNRLKPDQTLLCFFREFSFGMLGTDLCGGR